MTRETKFFNDSYYINDDSYFDIHGLERIREEFNHAFQKNNIDIIVDKDFTVNRLSAYEDLNYEYDQLDDDTIAKLNANLLINNFFFFPSHKLILIDDKKEQEIGTRMCFIKEGKHGLKVHVFDITTKQYQNIGKWTTEQHYGKKLKFMERFQDMYPSYMRIFKQSGEKLDKKASIVYTTQSGWVRGGHRWFYVPVSHVDEYGLIYNESVSSKYKMSFSNNWTLEEAFQKTWSMLDIAEKRITLPLLSYTFVSLITSLIGYNVDHMPKFMICISGSNKGLDRQGFANLFCNLYERKSNVSSLNSMFHLKSDMDKKMLEKKSSKIRDGIFIINADTRPKIIDRAIYSLHNYDVENMMLVLNEKKIDKEFVLNLNISDLDVDFAHLEQLRKYPELLSACIFYVTENFRNMFAHNEKSNKKKIGMYLHKRYKHFRKLIERNDIPQEVDKVHMYSCLLIGLDILLNVVKNELVVFDDKIQNDGAQAYLNEAVQLFQNECAIEGALMEADNESEVSEGMNSEFVKEEHIVFLEKLFECLPTPLARFEEKADRPDIFVWTAEDDENILSIENVVFRRILSSLDNTFDSLSTKMQQSSITKYKLRVYEKLRSEDLSIVLPKDEDPKNKKINIGTTEKDDYTGIRSSKTRRDFKVFRIDRGKALAYLNSLEN